jgi:hypothetical protein
MNPLNVKDENLTEGATISQRKFQIKLKSDNFMNSQTNFNMKKNIY